MAEANLSFSASKEVKLPDLAFAKIVSFSKPSSWSQVYNAGRLFAILSLKRSNTKEQETHDLLSQIGREILDKLEEEFFTIETKDLLSIKQAVKVTLQNLSDEIVSSFAAAVFTNNVLYLFAKGGAKVFIKRGEKFGTILDSTGQDYKSITASSGPLEDSDLIILSTKPFLDIIDLSFLFSSLGRITPAEIAEDLTPKVHEKEDGAAAAFIIKYIKQERATEQSSHLEETPIRFSHSKKIFLTVAVAILIILVSSIFFAVKKQNDSQTKALFEKVYANALKKYEDGNSLLDLNKNLARESLLASKDILENNKNEFKKNSKEQEQILTLLKKVGEGLVELENASEDRSYFLKTQIDYPKISLFTQDDDSVYFIDDNGINSLDKKTNKSEIIIKNNNYWKSPAGIGAYLGNIYVLDKDTSQILKFVQSQSGFTKTNYFSDPPPNMSNTVSLVIDGSIWILFKDGSIQKFIKGIKDTFNVSDLRKPLANPTRIFTNKGINSLYILDNGNSRIVVIGKDGKYRSEYQLDIIKNAKDFEVVEKSKKIYVLSQDKIYEIEAK